MQTKSEKENDYIIKNYKNKTYKELAECLGLKHSTVCYKIEKLRKEGRIGWKIGPKALGKEETKIQNENRFIINNYKNMRYKDIASFLGLSYSAVCTRIKSLRKEGKVGWKEGNKDRKRRDKQNLIETIEKQKPVENKKLVFDKGKLYEIEPTKRGHGNRKITAIYSRRLSNLHIFKCLPAKYKECFLDVDFITGDYRIKKIN